MALVGVVDPGWLDAKGRGLAARALGETPEYDPLTRPLTVSMYLEDAGLKDSQIRPIAGTFGKALKKRYAAAFGQNPPTVQDLHGRHMITVAQYQEQHRHLFDEVWRSMGPSVSPRVPHQRAA